MAKRKRIERKAIANKIKCQIETARQIAEHEDINLHISKRAAGAIVRTILVFPIVSWVVYGAWKLGELWQAQGAYNGTVDKYLLVGIGQCIFFLVGIAGTAAIGLYIIMYRYVEDAYNKITAMFKDESED